MLRGRYFTHGAAELTLARILAASRHLDEEEVRNFRSGRWMTPVDDNSGARPPGEPPRVIGLGEQGRQVARVGLAFGMDVVAWSEHLTAERRAKVGAQLVTRDERLTRIVSSNW
ncbi:MAG: NAD(P)-dependent oxidoreductase [Actinomycetota bacterium]|nr:NAD(P)-dependent oxidoreductase [Actinomycetota bacterium]